MCEHMQPKRLILENVAPSVRDAPGMSHTVAARSLFQFKPESPSALVHA